ncbi:hypothetical protein [Rhizobium hidalgonense]|uniref:hypothetical protein n=1 Tax=Rhizobium hidalgonense TaxID=1538159 RepID=UPI00110592AC|nr:hypothetical protein [Rhizobium hidalgonense]MDR9808563.1 hypothetical protein [Rhizobium hidalgonense]QKK25675.1 hypothetical protein FFM81_021055 [Rhizobium hidalgonense]
MSNSISSWTGAKSYFLLRSLGKRSVVAVGWTDCLQKAAHASVDDAAIHAGCAEIHSNSGKAVPLGGKAVMTPVNNSFIGGCKSVFDEEEIP